MFWKNIEFVFSLCFSPFESRFPINVGITGYVATTGEVCRDNNWVYVCGGYIYKLLRINY